MFKCITAVISQLLKFSSSAELAGAKDLKQDKEPQSQSMNLGQSAKPYALNDSSAPSARQVLIQFYTQCLRPLCPMRLR